MGCHRGWRDCPQPPKEDQELELRAGSAGRMWEGLGNVEATVRMRGRAGEAQEMGKSSSFSEGLLRRGFPGSSAAWHVVKGAPGWVFGAEGTGRQRGGVHPAPLHRCAIFCLLCRRQ